MRVDGSGDMEVIPAVRFPKIFSPRVLIRDSNRVNDFELQPSGPEPTGLTLSVHCWESPINPNSYPAFTHHAKRLGLSYRDSAPDYEPVNNLVSPGLVKSSTPDYDHRPSSFLSSPRFRADDHLRESVQELDQSYASPVQRWHWFTEGPQDLSISRSPGHPPAAVWDDRGSASSPTSDDQSKMTSSRSCSARFKGKVKIFKCPYCVITCSNRGQLLGHIRIHTGERPFVCQEPGCKKAFIRNEELTRHRRIHTGERPYVCDTCKKAFTRKDHLNKHVKIHSTVDDIFSV